MKFQKKYEEIVSTVILSFSLGLFISLIFTMILTGMNDGFFLDGENPLL